MTINNRWLNVQGVGEVGGTLNMLSVAASL
jgi:hypothetical protein